MRKHVCNNTTLTTGDVARICNVAPRTANGWCDTGRLKSHRLPPSRAEINGGDRRVYPEDLAAFLRAHGMRVPPDLLPPSAIYALGLVSHEGTALQALGVRLATCAFDLGVLCSETTPRAVVVGDADGVAVARAVVGCVKHLYSECLVALVLSEDAPAVEVEGVTVLRRPCNLALELGWLRE